MKLARQIYTMPTRQSTQKDINLTNLISSNLPITLPNYKTLCNLLGEPALNGKSKRLQVDNWKRFFKFEKVNFSGFHCLDNKIIHYYLLSYKPLFLMGIHGMNY